MREIRGTGIKNKLLCGCFESKIFDYSHSNEVYKN